MNRQLTLPVSVDDEATLSNFYVSDDNRALVDYLQHCFATPHHEFLVYLWGGKGSGRTHLLQAICHLALAKEKTVFYLSLQEMRHYQTDIFDGLEQFDIICLDDIDTIASDAAWQEALFHFYNRLRDNGSLLFVSATQTPQQLNFQLADLVSRLTWGVTFHLRSLTDKEKTEVLMLRAAKRGIKLASDVADFIIHRCPRNMSDLFNALERLDEASLIAKRKLTIPFVKEVLNI